MPGQNRVGSLSIHLYSVKLTAHTVPHTAFPVKSHNAAEVAPRESIEVRALVFHGGFDHGNNLN